MDLTTVSLVISVVALLLSFFAVSRPVKHAAEPVAKTSFESIPLRLQAYERLVLLTERISLPGLISRLNQPGISAAEMKVILTENIKQEFDYNSTQQLYVSQLSWDAVRNLKEQNIMLVNQVAASLAPAASAAELNKKILEVMMSQQNGAIHEMVSQTLNHEAKKLMQ
ncbi:MAG: hypothetical protein HZA79_05820 [Sphingobacteriales bacterium]|nr:hypothetical protein [Sphingobacteriales bacterium]